MADEMTPELKAALTENGFGDLDPETGPQNNPQFIQEFWAVKEFLGAANAHENPWVDTDYVPAKYADPRLDPEHAEYVPPELRPFSGIG